ncbi:MAG: HAMP domain-containing histidine kinase [Gallionellaceae bacterium]|nr:MAG: HAMP domain-containing histidine kinase [Gallionellaceae bacterium]
MNSSLLAVQTGHAQLQRLITLRLIAVLAQCATLAMVHYFLKMELPWLPMLLCIATLSTLNALSWLRLRAAQPVSNMELFAQLCVDVSALSVLLYYAGGSTNPFVSLYLLPLVIAAATLPQRYTWAMALITTACYTVLMKYYQPLPSTSAADGAMDMTEMANMAGHDHMHMQHAMPQDDAFNMHVFGMWLGFVISAAVVAYFVVKMASAVRERDEKLARAREETLRNERIIALGIQAASAAHEMGTPLSTLSVVIGELRHETDALPEWRESLTLLDGQVRNCKRILDKLLANAQDAVPASAQSLEDFVAGTLDEWQLLRPSVQHSYHTSGAQPAPQLCFDPSLRSALLNLLNNAADVSPHRIDIHVRWDDTQFTFEIQDHGPGLTPEAASNAGSAFFTTKEEGRGLGLFLANATIERLGGKVRLFNREGGATTEVILPLKGKQA